MFLGISFHKMKRNYGVWAWAMSQMLYVKEVVRNCEMYIAAQVAIHYRLPRKGENPYAMGYDPEMDSILRLSLDAALFFQSFIRILW